MLHHSRCLLHSILLHPHHLLRSLQHHLLTPSLHHQHLEYHPQIPLNRLEHHKHLTLNHRKHHPLFRLRRRRPPQQSFQGSVRNEMYLRLLPLDAKMTWRTSWGRCYHHHHPPSCINHRRSLTFRTPYRHSLWYHHHSQANTGQNVRVCFAPLPGLRLIQNTRRTQWRDPRRRRRTPLC